MEPTESLFDHIMQPAWRLPLGPVQLVNHQGGSRLFTQGQAGDTVHAIRKGMVRLEQRGPDGHDHVVRLLPPGHMFGLEVLAHGHYQHTATCVGPTQLCEASAPTLRRLATQNEALQLAVLMEWADVLAESDFVISHLSSGSAKQRVAQLLLHLSKASEQGDTCPAPSREQMASLLGLSAETVSRATAALKRERLISESHGVLQCDPEGLRAAAQQTPGRAVSS